MKKRAEEDVKPGAAEILVAEVERRWGEGIAKAKASEAARNFERSMDSVTRAMNTTPAEVADLCQRVLDRARKSV